MSLRERAMETRVEKHRRTCEEIQEMLDLAACRRTEEFEIEVVKDFLTEAIQEVRYVSLSRWKIKEVPQGPHDIEFQ